MKKNIIITILAILSIVSLTSLSSMSSRASYWMQRCDAAEALIDEMIELLKVEKENAIAAIPIVEFDSVIGFEPSMEYVTDRYRIEWKISQVDAEIELLLAEAE